MQPTWILYNIILAYNYETKLREREINKEFEIREAWGATVLIFIINILVILCWFLDPANIYVYIKNGSSCEVKNKNRIIPKFRLYSKPTISDSPPYNINNICMYTNWKTWTNLRSYLCLVCLHIYNQEHGNS